ncbi:PrsW family intramembrane metalloprotease [Corynebacterium sp.]|uniref:PrsW family intramembrane metalloprotease n=1 Tax=Corynebacterium sp. TaxID=1720 RepID=UPI0026DB2282|nr:PrsW family intramembrane metalloprotease [Corynebacterium sp.]MDO5077113.1 PrsW family intramembrane metalloprotease [Corynebacterium sp.]
MSTLIKSFLGGLIVLSFPMALLVVVDSLIVDFVATGANALFTLVQAALVLLLLRLSPMWPTKAHPMWVVSCLAWGAIGSIGLTLLIAMPTAEVAIKLGVPSLQYPLSGGYPEEITKGIGVLMIVCAFRCINRPWHGLVTGMLVGMAFDVCENFTYAAQGALMNPESDLFGVLETWGTRTLFGPGLHMMFAGFTGYGIGLALFAIGRSKWWRVRVGVFWLLFAFVTHFSWNLIAAEIFYGVIFATLVAYPTFISLIVVSWRQARRDSGYLSVQLQSGYSTPIGPEKPALTAPATNASALELVPVSVPLPVLTDPDPHPQ